MRNRSSEINSKAKWPSYTAWLLLDDNHAVPIADLDIDSIKRSARETVLAERAIAHQTKLNAIVGKLGFHGGFAGYKKEWPAVQAFMRQNGMETRFDFFNHRFDSGDARPAVGPCWWPHRRDAADRLFHSGRPMPEKLFVGHGFDWTPFDRLGRSHIERLRGKSNTINARDERAASLFFAHTEGGLHYLHDALVKPRLDDKVAIRRYFANEASTRDRARYHRQYLEGLADLRERIDAGTAGWARVLAFNPRLVFLVLDDGRYDFVFPDLRGSVPPQSPFAGNLDIGDLPNSILTTDAVWDHWLYFRRGTWLERDSHESEETFYSNGGNAETHPGCDTILQDLYRQRGLYAPPVLTSKEPLPGFQRVGAPNGTVLFVSDLVTIGELRTFLDDTGYAARRVEEIDRIEPPNRDADHLPATVNYFDALAYAAWFERKNNRPVRLLRIDEYCALHPGAAPVPSLESRGMDWQDWVFHTGCLEYLLPDGTVRESFGFIGDDETVRFKRELPWVKTAQGIRFLVTLGFGEWLFEHVDSEAAAICSMTLLSIHDYQHVVRDYFPSSSWGKYRRCKIGFRLCYEADGVLGG